MGLAKKDRFKNSIVVVICFVVCGLVVHFMGPTERMETLYPIALAERDIDETSQVLSSLEIRHVVEGGKVLLQLEDRYRARTALSDRGLPRRHLVEICWRTGSQEPVGEHCAKFARDCWN